MLSVKSGPQAAATKVTMLGTLPFHLGVVGPCLASSLQCLKPQVLCVIIWLWKVHEMARGFATEVWERGQEVSLAN